MGYELPTPSQTVGPFFNIGIPGDSERLAGAGAIQVAGAVFDGHDEPVGDALLEIWHADPEGRCRDGSGSFGRAETGDGGRYAVVTLKPGPVADGRGGLQAPHIAVSVFARGLLKRLVTRIYFGDETEANGADVVLAGVPAERRPTLIAEPDPDPDGGAYTFDVHLQGERETVFFDV